MRRLLGLEDDSDKNLKKEETDVETKVRDKKESDRNPKKPLTEIEKYLEKRRERRKRKKQKDEKGNSDAEGYGLTNDDFFVDEESNLS